MTRGWNRNAPDRCRSVIRYAKRDHAGTSLRSSRLQGEHRCTGRMRHVGPHHWREVRWETTRFGSEAAMVTDTERPGRVALFETPTHAAKAARLLNEGRRAADRFTWRDRTSVVDTHRLAS